jgi:hypothetical protein
MESNLSARPDPGLPPVAPPTGGMFLRLFGVPALIVGGLVAGVILLPHAYNWVRGVLTGRGGSEARTAQEFLRRLDDTNKEVRWQAASDLAQVLLRDDRLAYDGPFALELARRLDQVRAASADEEKAFAGRVAGLSAAEATRERTRLEPDRNYILYLGACLGNFMLPVGVPVLNKLAEQDRGMDPQGLAERRRQAVWALANLGENLKRFDKLAPDRQAEIVAALQAAQEGEQEEWARTAADYLRQRQEGRAGALAVDKALEKCATAEDTLLREMAAFAMNFWSGTKDENDRMEKALVRLSYDDGRGETELAQALEENTKAPTRTVIKRPGYRVQVNATVALARRGSPKVRVGLLREMLDADLLNGVFVVQDRKSGREQPDESLVASTLVNTLKAVAELHRLRPQTDLSALRPLIDRLAGDTNKNIQAEAQRTQLALAQ